MDTAAENTVQRPVPFNYTDYRKFLRDMIVHCKRTDRRFSYRYFARRAGLRSPNFLKLVAEGQRNLSADSIQRFSKALDLKGREHEAFELLVAWGQAASPEARTRYYERFKGIGGTPSPGAELERDQYEIYSRWYVIPIREMMLMADFEEDPVWIAQRLRPRVSPSDVKRALELLERVRLVTRGDDGRLQPHAIKLAATATTTQAMRSYHRATLKIAENTLDAVPVDKRNVTSLTLNLSSKQYSKVVERISVIRKDIRDLVEEDEDSAALQETHVVAFAAFPVTHRKKT